MGSSWPSWSTATILIADGFFRTITWPAQGSRAVSSSTAARHKQQRERRELELPRLRLGLWQFGRGRGRRRILLAILAVILFVIMVLLVAWAVRVVAPLEFTRLQVQLRGRARSVRTWPTRALSNSAGTRRRSSGRSRSLPRRPRCCRPRRSRSTAPLYLVDPIRRFERRSSGCGRPTRPRSSGSIGYAPSSGGAAGGRDAAATALEDQRRGLGYRAGARGSAPLNRRQGGRCRFRRRSGEPAGRRGPRGPARWHPRRQRGGPGGG